MQDLLTQIPATQATLVVALVLVLLQEAVNGFHDTANAIAAAVYSNAIEARYAVVVAAAFNFLGVILGGTTVAFALTYLLPVDMLVGISTLSEVMFLLALVTTAVLWNLTTWAFGIPNSTTHTYAGAILGVAAAHAFVNGQSVSAHMHWHAGERVVAALFLSPILGFVLAALVFRALRRFVTDSDLLAPAVEGQPPAAPIRALMIGGAAGISFLHGTNDGQKSIGLMFLVLVGLAPAAFGLGQSAGPEAWDAIGRSTREVQILSESLEKTPTFATAARQMRRQATDAGQMLARYDSPSAVPEAEGWTLRANLIHLQREASRLLKATEESDALSGAQRSTLATAKADVFRVVGDVPWWLMATSATFLGLGTAIGYRRIVVTLGEKMSSVKMTAAHGTATQLTAIACIALADTAAVPVSTTHVVTAGVAGSMRASGAGLQFSMIRGILITWFTTMPGCFILSFAFAMLLHSAVS